MLPLLQRRRQRLRVRPRRRRRRRLPPLDGPAVPVGTPSRTPPLSQSTFRTCRLVQAGVPNAAAPPVLLHWSLPHPDVAVTA